MVGTAVLGHNWAVVVFDLYSQSMTTLVVHDQLLLCNIAR